MGLQFIINDRFRLAVIEDLSKGEQTKEMIAKKNHLPAPAIERAVRELQAEEIVGGPDSSLYLTGKGRDMLKEVMKIERAGGEGTTTVAASRPPDRFRPEDSRRRKENQGT